MMAQDPRLSRSIRSLRRGLAAYLRRGVWVVSLSLVICGLVENLVPGAKIEKLVEYPIENEISWPLGVAVGAAKGAKYPRERGVGQRFQGRYRLLACALFCTPASSSGWVARIALASASQRSAKAKSFFFRSTLMRLQTPGR